MPNLIGSAANQVSTNGMLGTAAFMEPQTIINQSNIPTGLTRLAVMTPTVSANLDFLTLFTSGYDNYLIIGTGILPESPSELNIRLANAGVVDSASKYYDSTTARTASAITSTILATGTGTCFSTVIKNTNDSVNIKTIESQSTTHISTAPSYQYLDSYSAYTGTNTVSGFRLFLVSGGNFAAKGKIRVFGYNNI
jgi:hypothetical protein